MKKLVDGIIDYRSKLTPEDRERFAKLALGQSPDALFIACSDSRVVPNLFASTNPGDLFVIRNPGNLIPACGKNGISNSDESEAAAVHMAVQQLKIQDIIVCGHSECAAMIGITNGINQEEEPHLKAWLRHGEHAQKIAKTLNFAPATTPHNRISQANVLAQIENLKTYPLVSGAIAKNELRMHGWWFELQSGLVYFYNETKKSFLPIDKDYSQSLSR